MNEIIISTGAFLRILVVAALVSAVLSACVAALAVWLRVMGRRTRRQEALWEAEWRPHIFDVSLGSSMSAGLLEGTTGRQRVKLLELLLAIDPLLRGSARARVRSLGGRLLKPRDAAELTSRAPGVRAAAVRLLATFGAESYREALWGMLEDSSPLVVATAAHALVRTGRPEDAGHVLERAHRFSGWDRRLLTSLLTAVGPDAGVHLAETLVDEGREERVRVAAAEALRWLGVPQGASAAVAALSRTADREIQAACLRLLGAVGGPEYAMVVHPFCSDDDEIVRIHATSAYASLSRDPEGTLSEAAEDPSGWVSARAKAGLRGIQVRVPGGSSNSAPASPVVG